MRVAIAQLHSVVGDVDANVAAIVSLAREAAAAHARVLLTPELSLVGYDLDGLDDAERWFTADDPRLAPLRSAADALGIVIVVGAPTLAGGRRSLASLVIGGSAASEVSVVTKTHLHGNERDHFDAGDGATVLPVDDERFAFAICFDAAHPEHATTASAAGATVYAASSVYVRGEEQKIATRFAERARANGLVTVTANAAGAVLGTQSAGGSDAWDRQGVPLAQATGRDEELLIVELPSSPE